MVSAKAVQPRLAGGTRGEARIALCMVHYTQTEGNDKQNVQGGKEENQYFPPE